MVLFPLFQKKKKDDFFLKTFIMKMGPSGQLPKKVETGTALLKKTLNNGFAWAAQFARKFAPFNICKFILLSR